MGEPSVLAGLRGTIICERGSMESNACCKESLNLHLRSQGQETFGRASLLSFSSSSTLYGPGMTSQLARGLRSLATTHTTRRASRWFNSPK